MKIKGENLLFIMIRKIYFCLGERKFKRDILSEKKELSYDQVKEVWEDEAKLVHGNMEDAERYYSCINAVLEFKETDNVIDIGCGDGTIDSYIHVNRLYGIDISENKLNAARRKNPNYIYSKQNFLDEIDFDEINLYNKCFSYSVVQYCRPEDIDKLLKNSIDFILKTKKTEGGVSHKIVAHLDVPDIEKAYLYYQLWYGISKDIFLKYKDRIRTIFSDGSYWHDMRAIKEKCLQYLAEQGAADAVVVRLRDSNCYYRTDLVMILNCS